MKCPNCSNSHKLREGMQCSCGYEFVFNPRQHPKITDNRFVSLIRQASENGTRWYTFPQLYSRYCRSKYYRMPHRNMGCIFLVVLVALAAIATTAADGPVEVMWAAAGIGALILVIAPLFYRTPSREELQHLIDKWRKHGKGVDKLLEQPGLGEPPPDWPESDIYDYGAERLVVVERDLLVDLLVRNGWHADNKALVISENGYPSYLIPHAQKLLTERPDLPVFLLHDAGPESERMHERMARWNWLPVQNHEVTDLGLFRGDVKRLERLRPICPERDGYAAAIDSLPFSMLAAGAGAAAVAGVPLGALLDAQKQAAADTTSGFG